MNIRISSAFLGLCCLVGFSISAQASELWVCYDKHGERLQDHGGPGCQRQHQIEQTAKGRAASLRERMQDFFRAAWASRGLTTECLDRGLTWINEYESRGESEKARYMKSTLPFAERCITPIIRDFQKELASRPALKIVSFRCDLESGYAYARGEIENVSSQPMSYPKIVVVWRDRAGTLVDSDFTYAQIRPLAPGQRSPFQSMTRARDEFSQCSLTVQP